MIHKKIIHYFNAEIFKNNLISEDIKHPQRHFWGNKEELKVFIKKRNKNICFSLVDVLNDLKKTNCLEILVNIK